jgi:hypothetical protein
MSDVKDINDHITRQTELEDGSAFTEYASDADPGTPPVLEVKIAIHPDPDGEGAFIYGIQHKSPEDGQPVTIGVVLESALALYIQTSEQLIADLPKVIRDDFREILLGKLNTMHNGFIGAVDRQLAALDETRDLLAKHDGDVGKVIDEIIAEAEAQIGKALDDEMRLAVSQKVTSNVDVLSGGTAATDQKE